MKEQVIKVVNDIREFWGKLGKKTRILIFSGVGIILIFSLLVTFFLNKKEYVVLFRNISKEETVEVMQQLQENNVEYKYQNDGTILIPEKQESLLRMKLAETGHPRTGSGYSLFMDSIDFMTTDYEKRVYEVYQLQERIQDSIKTIDGVNDAIVTINLPEEKSFAWETDKEEASASVKLSLASGRSLTSSQISGIEQLVSTGVKGLKKENVAILDTDGNSLSQDDDMLQTNAMKIKLQIEKEIVKETTSNVKGFLAAVYGPENVQVSSNCKINFDKKISEILKYLPDEESKKGVPQETQNEREIKGPGETTGGVPGTDANAEIPTYPGVTVQGDDIYFKDKNTINYLVSQLKEQIEYNPGSIENLTVAVVINKKTMTDDEQEKVKDLVANSAGIKPENVALHNMEFYDQTSTPAIAENPLEEVPGISRNLLIYGGIGLGAFAILIFIISIILSKRKKKKAALMAAGQAKNMADGEKEYSWTDVQEEIKLQETEEQVIRKQLQEFTKNNPEISAQLIRTLIKGEEQ